MRPVASIIRHMRLDPDREPVGVEREPIEAQLGEVVLAGGEQDEVGPQIQPPRAQIDVVLVGAPARHGRGHDLDRPHPLGQAPLDERAE